MITGGNSGNTATSETLLGNLTVHCLLSHCLLSFYHVLNARHKGVGAPKPSGNVRFEFSEMRRKTASH